MFFYVAKIGWLLIQPLVIIAAFVACAAGAYALGLRRTAFTLVGLAAAGYVLAVFTPLGLLMTAALENRFPRPTLPERVSGIILLGGSFDTRVARTRGISELNEAADRVTATMTLARLYPDAQILFSGGVAAVLAHDVPETTSALRVLTDLGLDPARLLLDDRARDTFENALYAKRLASPVAGETWVLVTSAAHMPRAIGCFRKVGFDVVPYPVDYQTPGGAAVFSPSSATVRNLEKVHFAIREYLGLLAYWLAGRTSTLFPGPVEAREG